MKNYFKFLIVSVLLMSGFSDLGAQVITIDNATINACGGEFVDDAAGSSYTDTNYTMTICPDNPGDAVSLSFQAFSLQTSANPNNSDYLLIFDGDNTGAPSLGNYAGNSLQGLDVTATIFNPTGCLTIQFICNTGNTNAFPGWSAFIACTTPCANPTSQSEILDPEPENLNVQSVGVCLDQEVTFGDAGSFPADGFSLDQYIWNFDDGTIDTTSGAIASHAFSEPGEYLVTLTVQDNNGCQSLNLEPLQVLVSTLPEFNIEHDEEICLGASVDLDGSPTQSVTWTALPPQIVSGEDYLADGAGFSYSTPLLFDIFEPDAVLEDCDDLFAVNINMEHSYMGDLNMQVSCPNGTTVTLLDWPNGGGACYLGEAVDDASEDPGVGYTYTWTPTSTNGFIDDNANWTMTSYVDNNGNQDNNNIANPIDYQAVGNLCDLVGCPLNGEWTLTITDNLGADNGYVFFWGIDFNPVLLPDITTFTPIIGLDADSSFWSGPDIVDLADDGNFATSTPQEAGSYEYTYTVTNNFSCTFDTTIVVQVNALPEIFVDDEYICEGADGQLIASLDEDNPPVCSEDAGDYTYCYTNNDNTSFTYCPDNQGDGVTFMSITFNSGQVENFFDDVTFYDGSDTSAPVLGMYEGDLTGITVTATNPSGCITMVVNSDGSVSCESGSFDPMSYSVGCNSGLEIYEFEWTPGDYLSSTTSSGPQVLDAPGGEYDYSVSMYPDGYPECAVTTDATVFVTQAVDAGEDSQAIVCASDNPVDLFDFIDGTPETGGVWLDANQNEVEDVFDPATDPEGQYTYLIDTGGCADSSLLDLEVNSMILESILDTTVCINGAATFNGEVTGDPNDNVEYYWSGTAGDFIGQSVTIEPPSNPTVVQVYAVYGDNCITNEESALISQYAPLSTNIMNPETICQGDDIELETLNTNGGLEPYSYVWNGDNGAALIGTPVTTSIQDETTFCVTIDDACETTPIEECVTISIEPVIDPNFDADLTEGCSPIFVNFTGYAEDPEIVGSVIWDFGDGTVANSLNYASHYYETPGTYDVSLTLTSIQGCTFDTTYTNYVDAYPNPDAEFSAVPQTAYLPNTTFNFVNNSFGAALYEWQFGYYGTSFEFEPDFEFPTENAQQIEVTLVATNQFGCTDTVSKNIFIQEQFEMYVPNAFTPDGDGVNDFFFVYGQDVNLNDYNIQIFDRWGQKVWESDNIDQPWDGSTFNDGYYVKEGVYVWRIETRSLSTAEKKEIMGHVTLLR